MSRADEEMVKRCRRILDAMPSDGLFAAGQVSGAPCRIGPEPFRIPEAAASRLELQGRLWLKFLKAAHALYLKSLKGRAPCWVAEYLDAGKPDRLLQFGRMNRFKGQFPIVLRPDLLLTEDGAVACELDSVPGGIGLLACMTGLFEKEGIACAGSPRGMLNGFKSGIEYAAGKPGPAVGIVVSEESRMYLPEMRWLAGELKAAGMRYWQLEPGDLEFSDGVPAGRERAPTGPLDVIYRFFELFDLENVPNSQALLESAKLKKVRLTPPPKAHLEEKSLFALFHHGGLKELWRAELGDEDFSALLELILPTWILDSRPLPPHAEIGGIRAGGTPINSWKELAPLSQKERDFVIKPSGFSPNAWGSRGVNFGADLSHEAWSRALDRALADFPGNPWILQPYRKPSLVRAAFFDPASQAIKEIEGRVRLCPYYFVTGEDSVSLGGVLATICPADKKAIHGMPEAVMLPCQPLRQ